MLIHWIWFAQSTGLSHREKLELLQQFRDPEDIYYANGDAFSGVEGLTAEGAQALADKNLVPAEEILEACARERIHILTYRDAAYPAKLKNTADPPLILYYKGRLPEFDRSPLIAVVGTRRASAYGLGVAKRMGYQIGKCGGIVVSGLAYGIDGMAMRGALTAGQTVVGVLGCGVDVVYPASNRGLFTDTMAHGCLISEYPPGTEPFKWNFPRRNRIISGISDGVLIVEAPEKSGALITARQGLEQGRDVFVVPGNVDVPTCAGSNALLRDGAIAVANGWDVMEEYVHLYPDKIRKDTSPGHQSGYPDEVAKAAEAAPKVAQKPKNLKASQPIRKKKEKKGIDKPASLPYSDGNDTQSGLSDNERKVVELLSGGEQLVDDVIARVELPAGTVQATLTMLEIKGVISRLPGNRVRRK